MSVKTFLIGAGGFVAGALVGYFFGKKRNEEMDREMAEAYDNACHMRLEERRELVRLRKEHDIREKMEQYSGKGTDETEVEPEPEIEILVDHAPEEERFPIEIEENDALNGEYCESYIETFTYYRGDNTLVDSGSEIVGDAENLFGKEVADSLPTTEKDVIYVHNFEHDANFEIVMSDELSPATAFDFDDLDDDLDDIFTRKE